jgi:hypothetical protein
MAGGAHRILFDKIPGSVKFERKEKMEYQDLSE